ncbi:MAG TPA: cupin domain-containing protein [Bryobacteraceae bacterium]|nr:cupin domain-containing protein [Bryobacteraceae bacterium]
MNDPLSLAAAFDTFQDHWRPRIAARLNDYVVKLVKFQGEFVWHKHEDTDELFLVHKGEMTIRFRDRDVAVRAGQLFVIPRGVEHITLADSECEALLLEPSGTRNTGDVTDENKTAILEPEIMLPDK